MERVDILIADDHDLFIEGLVALLADAPDINFLAIARNGEEAIGLTEEYPKAHLLIMDISMPKMDGIEAMRELKRKKCTIPVLALTQNADSGSITRAMKAGVSGYIMKTADREEFLQAIRTVSTGEQFFSETAKETIIFHLTGRKQKGVQPGLTKREKEILKLIAQELTTNEIAEQLFISPYTVETHRKNLIQKLNVRSLAGLVRYAVECGLLDE